MKKSVRYVYTLKHPISGDIKYVGCTDDPEIRLRNHIRLVDYGKSECKDWIKSLITEGILPVLEVIEECTNDWQEIEKYWINHYRESGYKLCNQTIGGRCGKLSPSHTKLKESQVKLALSMISNGEEVIEAEKKAGLSNGYLYKVRNGKVAYLKHIHIPYFRKFKALD